MAVPAVTAAVKAGIKVFSYLVDTDDLKRIVGFLIAAIAAIVLFVVMLPALLLTMPFASNNDVARYIQVAQQIQKAKGVTVPWQDLMAIDAVRFHQDFSQTNEAEITELADQFLQKNTRIVRTCKGQGPNLHCSTTSKTSYSTRSLSGVLELISLTTEQQQQVQTMVQSLTAQSTPWHGAKASRGVYRWMPEIGSAAHQYGLEPALLAAIMSVESGGNPSAVSSGGAEGVMQMMPSTAMDWGVANPFDPNQEIPGAAKMIAGLYRKYNGNIILVAAAYNAGSGAVEKYGGVPPYPETHAYVTKVESSYQYYQLHPMASK